jgi:catechol 2,3-dioxygenase-like lactoylglutathione lyase family enzyme
MGMDAVKAVIGHIGLNLEDPALDFPFWKDLLAHLGFRFSDETATHFDAGDGYSYLCVTVAGPSMAGAGYHRRRIGLNHLAFRVDSPDEVDRFVVEFLQPRGITPLYGGARAYPEYSPGYYAVFFEDRLRIKIEVVCEPAAAPIPSGPPVA